jgi:hypothetical protein
MLAGVAVVGHERVQLFSFGAVVPQHHVRVNRYPHERMMFAECVRGALEDEQFGALDIAS